MLHRIRGMLATPRFSRGPRAFPLVQRMSKSRLNPKGLRRVRRDRLPSLAAKTQSSRAHAKEQRKTLAAKNPSYPAWPAATRPRLFDLARETNAIDAVKADLERFDALDCRKRRSRAAGAQPGVFRRRAVAGAVGAVLDRAGIGGLAAKFLKLVTTNRRLFAVRDMVRAYRELVAEHKGEAIGRGHGGRTAQGRTSRRAALARSNRSAARMSISPSKSIPRSSAGSWSSSAAAWSTPRCAPNSMRSGMR